MKQVHKEISLINSKNRMFNSFSVTLMIINFLIEIDYLPELQEENNINKQCGENHKIISYSPLCTRRKVKWFSCVDCFEKYHDLWDTVDFDWLFIYYFYFYLNFDFSNKISSNPTYFKRINETSPRKTNTKQTYIIGIISPFLPFLNYTKSFYTQFIQMLTEYRKIYDDYLNKRQTFAFCFYHNNDIQSLIPIFNKHSIEKILYYYIGKEKEGIVFMKCTSFDQYVEFMKEYTQSIENSDKSQLSKCYFDNIMNIDSSILQFEPTFTTVVVLTN